jgi:hypothetical protein
VRKSIAEQLCGWLTERKHHIVLAGIDKAKLNRRIADPGPSFSKDPWLGSAVHIALQVQKVNQGKSHNKGLTFLVFDENKAKADALAELLWDSPEWTDDYYNKKKQERLDQVIDSAFTVKSHHAGLVQVADPYALIFRRYSEFRDFGATEEWPGEGKLIDGYVEALKSRLLPKNIRWPNRARGGSAKWFNSVAPDSLVALGE